MAFTLRLKNYRSFRDLNWSPPNGVNVVVGPNGAGKTTLLTTIDFLRTAYLRSLGSAFHFNGGAWGVRNLFASDDELVEIDFGTDGLVWHLEPGIESNSSNGDFREVVVKDSIEILVKKANNPKFEFDGQQLNASDMAGLRKSFELTESEQLAPLVNAIRNSRFYSDYKLGQLIHRGSENTGEIFLSRDGTNAFTVLRNWRDKRSHQSAYEFVRKGIKDAFPDLVEDFTFEVTRQSVSLQFYLRGIQDEIPVTLLPDGVLVGLLHLTALAGAEDNAIIAIDEMENALHPYAIRSITETMREIAYKRKLTVLLSTHSPVLLDEFKKKPERVFVLRKGEKPIAPLTELRDPDWLGHFSLGKLFSNEEFGSPRPNTLN